MSVKIILMTKDSTTLSECLDSIYSNTSADYELWIVNGGESILGTITNTPYPQVSIFNSSSMEGFNNQLIKTIERVKEGFFVSFPDDCFPEPHWLEYALEDFNNNFDDGMGLLALNEGMGYKGKKAPLPITTKEFVKKYLGGAFIRPEYNHYFGDDDLGYRVKKLNGNFYAYSARSVVRHKHINNPEEMEKFWKKDKATYKRLCP